MRLLSLFVMLYCAIPAVSSALVSEGRPGVPYVGHVLYLQSKLVENDKVLAVSLGFADPRNEHIELCNNSIDVFGGLELFRDIPEKSWVLVDYELQSILIAEGFAGDADVSRVTACDEYERCMALSEQAQARATTSATGVPAVESTTTANLENIQQRLEIGRRLVKAARCRGCHSLEGFGAEHAPSLTWKRFKYEPDWLKDFLQAPYRMRPAMADLMMLKYTSPNAKPSLKPEEAELVAEYLVKAATASAPSEQFRLEQWRNYDCYACHTRLYQAKPLVFTPTPIPPEIRQAVETSNTVQSCLGCHPFGDLRSVTPLPSSQPNAFATDLLLAFEKLTLNYLTAFLKNPSYLEPETRMPSLGLGDSEIAEIRSLARQVKEAIETGRLKPRHVYYEMEKQGKP